MNIEVTESANEKLVSEIILAGLTKVVNEGEYYYEDGMFKLSSDGQVYMDIVSRVAKDAYTVFGDRSIADMEG